MAATITSAAGALTTASAGDLATVSMTADANYQIAGTCIQECLFWVEGKIPNGLGLPYQLGCLQENTDPVYNGCYCTSAVAAKASSIISIYVSSICENTAQISDAISIYRDYCTSAGYPTNANAQATSPANAGTTQTPGVTVVTSNVVYTSTVGSSTSLVTEPGFQTVTTTPQQSSSTTGGSGGGSKSDIGAIVGGVLGGAIFIIALVVGVWFCSRRGNSQSKARTDAEIPGSIFVPSGSVPPLASAGVKKAFGRAELGGEKGGVVEVVSPISAQDGVSPVGGEEVRRGPGRAELEGRYGLRPEELDSEGRYVGELHGDGRQGHYGGGVELEGSEVLR